MNEVSVTPAITTQEPSFRFVSAAERMTATVLMPPNKVREIVEMALVAGALATSAANPLELA